MPCVAENDKIWNGFKWLIRDRYECWKLVCAYRELGVRRDAHDMGVSQNFQKTLYSPWQLII